MQSFPSCGWAGPLDRVYEPGYGPSGAALEGSSLYLRWEAFYDSRSHARARASPQAAQSVSSMAENDVPNTVTVTASTANGGWA